MTRARTLAGVPALPAGLAAAAALLVLTAAAPAGPRALTAAETAATVGGGSPPPPEPEDPISCCETIDACEADQSCADADHDDDPSTPPSLCQIRIDEVVPTVPVNDRGCGFSQDPNDTCSNSDGTVSCLLIYRCKVVDDVCVRGGYNDDRTAPLGCDGPDC